MNLEIVLGIPDVENYWNDLSVKFENGKLSGKEKRLFTSLLKLLNY